MTNSPESVPASRIHSPNASIALAVASLLLLCAAALPAHSQIYQVVYNFADHPDGASPAATLIRDKDGIFYGTTVDGGSNAAGTVFKLEPDGKETVLYSFDDGAHGGFPAGGLVRDAEGNLYGTTGHAGPGDSYGIVYKLDPAGNETVLHGFATSGDGKSPSAGLLRDPHGNFYGVTLAGGAWGYGTVFKLDKNGTETILHSFAGTPDGSAPAASLIMDEEGNLYGTTESGGGTGCDTGWPGCGTVFKLDKNGKETILHRFTAGLDGAVPLAPVAFDDAGNLYGTTSLGGGANQYGTVFKITKAGKETVFYRFGQTADAGNPVAGVIFDRRGNIYGTVEQPTGMVFELSPTAKLNILHFFNYFTDGNQPAGGVTWDGPGSLWGTTSERGAYGYGTVFKLELTQ